MEQIELVKEELQKNRAKRDDLELTVLKLKAALTNTEKQVLEMEQELTFIKGVVSSLEFVKTVLTKAPKE